MQPNLWFHFVIVHTDVWSKIRRACCGDPAEELEGLCRNFSSQRRDSVSEQELSADPGCSVGPPHPQDPHQYSAGRRSAGLDYSQIYVLVWSEREFDFNNISR